VRSGLALDDSLVFVAAARDSLLALDARDGAPRWGIGLGGALYGPPLVVGDRLYCVTYAGDLCAIETRTGALLATRRLPGFFRAGLGGPRPLVALSTAGRVCAVAPESLTVLWERELEHVGEWTPTLARGTVWIGLRDGSVFGLDADDGAARYEVRVTPPVSAPVLIDPGFVLIGGGRGELVAYRWVGGRDSSEWGRIAQPNPPAENPSARERARLFPQSNGIGATGVAPGAVPAPGGLAVRSLCSPSRERARSGIARWRWVATAGWAACTTLALWLQREADDEYEVYLYAGEAQRREDAFSRANDYDRAVIGAWLAAEGCFVTGVKAWLARHDEGRTP
jgi:hypothetical protein